MAGYLNRVTLLGNLGADPEVRNTQAGTTVVSFNLATNESWTDRTTGEKKERTEWHRIVIFGDGLTGIAENYLRKGSKVYLEGQLRTRKWTDRDDQERYTTEIVLQSFDAKIILLDGSNRNGGGAGRASDSSGYHHSELDDEVPF